MPTLFPVAGSKLYTAAASKPTPDNADWLATNFTTSPPTWIEIGGWTKCGPVGDMAEIIKTKLINRNRTVKQKGTRDAGSMDNEFAALPADPGQLILIAQEKTALEYPYRLVFPDAPSPGTPTTLYFTGLANGARYGGGEADTIQTFVCTIEINSNIVVVAATAS